MSLESKFETFKSKHDLNDDAIAEILVIFNEAFVELAHKLLASNDIQVTKNTKISKTYTGPKKWATRIAAEYAAENEVTLDDFDKEKITKKDIDDFVKSNNKMPKLNTNTIQKKKVESIDKEDSKSNTEPRIKCKGLTKNGEPCNRVGTEKPSGSKNCFCFRHAMDWKNYEVSSDSELEEDEDIFKDPNKIDIPESAFDVLEEE